MTNDDLAKALVRLLFNSVADGNECTCAPKDPCPECQAMRALGLGRWRNFKSAQQRLARLALERRWRIM